MRFLRSEHTAHLRTPRHYNLSDNATGGEDKQIISTSWNRFVEHAFLIFANTRGEIIQYGVKWVVKIGFR